MPFKSQAQRRKFYAMLARGEISKAKVEEWDKATGKKKLPERVKKVAKHAKKARKKVKKKTKAARK